MLRPIHIAAFICVLSFSAVRADITTVSFDSGGQTLFNNLSTVLSGGTSADGNGDVLQLGYFTGANFTGTFVPLSGEGSLNTAVITGSSPLETYNHTSIGDLNGSGAGNGQYALSLDFTLGSATSGNSLPSAGTQLAIRFYNNTTIASSTFFNTVTDPLWIWQNPATPPSTVNMSLDDSGLIWQSISQGQNVNTAFHTSIATAVPEPSTLALLALAGFVGMPVVRRKLNKRS